MVGKSGVASCVVEEPGLGVDIDEPSDRVDGLAIEIGVPCACCAIVVQINEWQEHWV